MAIDPPWRLDPTQNITNVHWRTKEDDIWLMTMFSATDINTGPDQTEFIQVAYAQGNPIVNYNVDFGYLPNDFLPFFYPYADRRQYRTNTMAPDGSPDVSNRYLLPDTVSVLDLQRLRACSFDTRKELLGHYPDGHPYYSRCQSFLLNATQLAGGNFGYFLLLLEFRHGGYFQGLGYSAPLWFDHFSFKLMDPTKPLVTSLAMEGRTTGGIGAPFLIRRPAGNTHLIAHTGSGLTDPRQGYINNRSISFVQVWLEDGEPP